MAETFDAKSELSELLTRICELHELLRLKKGSSSEEFIRQHIQRLDLRVQHLKNKYSIQESHPGKRPSVDAWRA